MLFANTPTKLVGRIAVQDAGVLSKERAPSPGVVDRLAELRESFAVDAANLPDRAFVAITPGMQRHFRSSDVDIEGWRGAMRAQAASIRAARARCALPAVQAPRALLSDLVPIPRRRRESGAGAPFSTDMGARARPPPRARTRFG